ncbi:hypothetical protein RO3G_10841 [Rhizopus delemar RA 99-880]|uniref:Uncharacterized protein n=1 Tax=Rhizopus delemar (strain RA 99-880 / ATCC MYA-4621 / FGSC 9543 / NRRL 43880) TaxID=246409 RepID=I1CCF0_RHIO9|nr:hypothetical protein RO3G_10841 [Rhizopus delemar RA 99-880]|eukprot:EIE86130.1 hypothetical protein RO3G_10841 [Rhizopus delemar RA 99-880]
MPQQVLSLFPRRVTVFVETSITFRKPLFTLNSKTSPISSRVLSLLTVRSLVF